MRLSGNFPLHLPSSSRYDAMLCIFRFISDRAFEGCSGMLTLHLLDSIRFIGDAAFAGCVRLTSLVLPSELT